MQNSNNTSSIIIPEIQVPAADYLQYLRESEISHLVNGASDDLRRCALGIAHTGQSTDDTEKLFEMYPNFGIEITRVRQGVSFILKNVPKPCFIEREGQLECKENIRQHLSAVVRDLLYSTITKELVSLSKHRESILYLSTVISVPINSSPKRVSEFFSINC